ncbi:rhodanese-like domain protein [Asticcacaulis biprosthecium C19]|uniref:Rhodanese-like domain protein n=1 Tax=Asticcacaulis biprosthecium C19 TaxID=715226 RepID=F4QTF2_9CAUL|nr:rhodanese-like domain-containing protein [Asticcacaulis biprosthecium]EGF90022.1 rhodanese-like domain protein [Asticcacaulis biprosthecium C19]
MFNLSSTSTQNLDPDHVRDGLRQGNFLLVDVREPEEYQAERIAGAINAPLSSFDPKSLPVDGSKTVVLHCAGGVRSGRALDACRKAGVAVSHHLAGGLSAWKASGLPTVR